MYNDNYNRLKNKTHIEDSFDLDDYKSKSKTKRNKNEFKKNKKIINLISTLIGVFSFVLAILFYQLFSYYLNLHKSAQISQNSKNTIGDINLITSNAPLFDATSEDNFVPIDDNKQTDPLGNNAPNTKEVKAEIETLRRLFDNDDIVGHVKIAGTNIDYDVVQYEDDEYYLDKDLYKNNNDAGSIFMDKDSNINPLSNNIILYGHNMRNGSMFHNVRNYRDYNYFKEHKYIDFMTTYENTRWEVFSFYETTIEFDYITSDFHDEATFQRFIDDIVTKSHFITDLEVTTKDNILTLSTCTNVTDDARFVIHAKLIEVY